MEIEIEKKTVAESNGDRAGMTGIKDRQRQMDSDTDGRRRQRRLSRDRKGKSIPGSDISGSDTDASKLMLDYKWAELNLFLSIFSNHYDRKLTSFRRFVPCKLCNGRI